MSQLAKLNNILESRYSGATSLSGFRYQILYSVLRMFDLFSNENIHEITFEGIEDIDFKGLNVGNQHIQVKTSSNKQGWGWINQEKVLDKYIEVFKIDAQTIFITAINFEPTGDLASLVDVANRNSDETPDKLLKSLQKVANRCNLPFNQISTFVRSLKFDQNSESEIIDRINQSIIKYFDIDTGNEGLYLLALFSRILELATLRSGLNKTEIIRLQLEITDLIGKGVVNPVVQEGWLQPLEFSAGGNLADYYEGKSARPSHIQANLDAVRPRWLNEIDQAFKIAKVCIIRASSGQGKSTLAYRYAYNNFDKHTVLLLNQVDQINMITPLKSYIESRLQLGLPVLIIIDDLHYRLKNWDQLVKELVGEDVYFLITAREENWFRYSNNLYSFSYTSVFLRMSLEEAKTIYSYFDKEDKIADNVTSFAWAYDKVADRKLLIEFVFLITHGQMLAERLEQQVKTIQLLKEDNVKLEILRLVSLAQILSIKINIGSLMQHLDFRDDPDLVMQSLKSEYLLIEGTFIEGLHFVRSEHLISILHQIVPLQSTIEKLILIASDEDLHYLIRSVFSGDKFALSNDGNLLAEIVERTHGKPSAILSATKGFFEADEQNYFLANRYIFDEIFERFGTAGLTIFTGDTLPATKLHTTDSLLNIAGRNHENLQRTHQLLDEISERGVKEKRNTRLYLEQSLQSLNEVNHETFQPYIEMKIWASFYGVNFTAFDQFIEKEDWKTSSLFWNVPLTTWLNRVLWHSFPNKYQEVIQHQFEIISRRFLMETQTLSLIESNDECSIRFIVDEEKHVHNQTLDRLKILANWLPHYKVYHSQGLFPISPIERLNHDDTKKNIAREDLHDDFNVMLNASYIKVVNENYNFKSFYEWMTYITELRADVLVLIQSIIKRHEDMLIGKNSFNLQNELDIVHTKIKELPVPPNRVKTFFQEEGKDIDTWVRSTENFIRSYFTSKDQNDERLLRLNLLDAWVSLPAMQLAVRTIIQSEISYLEYKDIDDAELRQYKYLSNLIEYQQGISSNYRVPPKVKPKNVVESWEKRRKREIKRTLVEYFSPVDSEGLAFSVYLPDSYLEEPPMKNLCIGIELLDATKPFLHLESLILYLAALDLYYDFIYIPLFINKKPFGDYVYRINHSTVNSIAKGEIIEKIAIFPVSISNIFFDILGIKRESSIPEYYLIKDAQYILLKLESLKNELFFVQSYLAFADMFPDYEQQMYDRHTQLTGEMDNILNRASRFVTHKAHKQWYELWEHVKLSTSGLSWEKISSITLNSIIEMRDDPQIEVLYGEYLNSAYLIQ